MIEAAPRIELIVAVSDNGVIGRDGALPWRLARDMAHFRSCTSSHCMIMGRKTYESIGGPLPTRVSIVVSRSPVEAASEHERVLAAGSLEDAVALVATTSVAHDRVWVVGGGEIYRLALPLARAVELTRVHTTCAGDTTFPALAPREWSLVSARRCEADDANDHPCTFERWERRAVPRIGQDRHEQQQQQQQQQ